MSFKNRHKKNYILLCLVAFGSPTLKDAPSQNKKLGMTVSQLTGMEMIIMKITKLFVGALVAATLSTAASAQVAASFDGLVDGVLAETNAAFFSSAVNVSDIDASVSITAGLGTVAGSASESVTESTDNATSDIDGSTREITSNVTEAASATDGVSQNFGDISTVAAGAISDSTMTLNETGALASSAITTSSGLTDFSGNASNTAGGTVGVVQGALNTGSINSSVNVAMANAAGGATAIGTVAAGAINTGAITATFVGGSEAETNVTP